MTDQPPQAPTLPELRVSAHQLLLDPGLFCIYHTPSPRPVDAWLPAVRLAATPHQPGHLLLSGLGEGGWLQDAALVRVERARASLLVTIYQAAAAATEAPHLKVLRLTEPAPPGPTPTATGLLAHIYAKGDVPGRVGEWIGERGSRSWIEGFALALPPPLAATEVEYQAVLGRDWLSPWAEGGQFCGSRGMSLPILGLAVRLRGDAAESHTLALSASFIDGSAAGPVSDGQACQSDTLAPLEAFQLVLSAKPPRRAARPKG